MFYQTETYKTKQMKPIKVTIDVNLTPQTMAELFCNLTPTEQAAFFNEVASFIPAWRMPINYDVLSSSLTAEAKSFINTFQAECGFPNTAARADVLGRKNEQKAIEAFFNIQTRKLYTRFINGQAKYLPKCECGAFAPMQNRTCRNCGNAVLSPNEV